ncbi:protein kinase family protein [Paraburkholderia tropica]|uniref:serine/threonine protein kinase n=1 Tax=Paraburkholderia tropica TaxID=92647 RepID=UPI002AB24027|nr:serine/threonine protein kinase [Paraburkholderia tropica]
MAYPSLEQYNNAFNNHSIWLTDPELKAGTVGKTGLGLPLAISGGFALTYTITAGSKKYAVRCFHRESKALERRYTAISQRLSTLRSPYFLDFKFESKGIRIDGREYPIVKMAWAKGETLGEFLEDNHGSPQALGALASSLVSLSAFLENERIAHGDIQTGNLMVSGGGSGVQLIDYDGMWIDEIKDLGSAEIGHVNFQHPGRKASNPFDATLDRFSLISLWFSIEALRVDPSIWRKTNSESDAVVFRANDFIDPSSSPAFALIAKNTALAQRVQAFAAICSSPMQKAPSLSDFIAGKNLPGLRASVVLAGKTAAGKPKPGYIGAYEVLSATDYEACLRSVGSRVEVIGRIVEIKHGLAVNRKPYVFVNFGSWRGRIFKIAIWSDGLDSLRVKPDDSWVGKWVSVVGLMEPPYENRKHKYSHLSVSVTSAGQMTVLSEGDARWRLAVPHDGSAVSDFLPSAVRNSEILERVQDSGRSAAPVALRPQARPIATPAAQPIQQVRPSTKTPPAAPAAKQASTQVSSNQAVLDRMKSSQSPPPTARPLPPPSHKPKPVVIQKPIGGGGLPPKLRSQPQSIFARLRQWFFGR